MITWHSAGNVRHWGLRCRYLSTDVFGVEAGKGDPAPCTVSEFPSAVARLVAFPEPHFVVFRADDDPDTGGSSTSPQTSSSHCFYILTLLMSSFGSVFSFQVNALLCALLTFYLLLKSGKEVE